MSHNPHGVTNGECVILDEDMLTAREVKILHITRKGIHSIVCGEDDIPFQVMTKRLTKKSPLNSKIWQTSMSSK